MSENTGFKQSVMSFRKYVPYESSPKECETDLYVAFGTVHIQYSLEEGGRSQKGSCTKPTGQVVVLVNSFKDVQHYHIKLLNGNIRDSLVVSIICKLVFRPYGFTNIEYTSNTKEDTVTPRCQGWLCCDSSFYASYLGSSAKKSNCQC